MQTLVPPLINACVHSAPIDRSIATSQPEFLPTEVGQLWEAINAKQKQKQQFATMLHQIFKNSVDFVGNKATNHVLFFIEKFQKCGILSHLLTQLNVLLTFGCPCQPAWFINNRKVYTTIHQWSTLVNVLNSCNSLITSPIPTMLNIFLKN